MSSRDGNFSFLDWRSSPVVAGDLVSMLGGAQTHEMKKSHCKSADLVPLRCLSVKFLRLVAFAVRSLCVFIVVELFYVL